MHGATMKFIPDSTLIKKNLCFFLFRGTPIHIGVPRKQFGKRRTKVMEQSPSREANIRLEVQEILHFGKRNFHYC
jgi:hypothetical protein